MKFIPDAKTAWFSDPFQKVQRCILLLLCIGQISCAPYLSPLVSNRPASDTTKPSYTPLATLYTILIQDQSATLPAYRLAVTPSEIQDTWVVRRGTRLNTILDMPLEIDDEVWTGPNSTAVIRFLSGSMVYLRPSSHIRIGSIFMFIGELFVRVKGVFQVDTEFVTAGSEGTEWVMKVLANVDSRCIVLQGRINMESKGQRWKPALVGANEQFTWRGQDYRKLGPASLEDLNKIRQWVSQIDQIVSISQDSGNNVPRNTEQPSPSANTDVLPGIIGGIIGGAILHHTQHKEEDKPPQQPPPTSPPPIIVR